MTKLTMVDLDVLCVDMGASSTIPLLHTVNTRTDPPRSVLGEDDELYLEYRFVKSAFPYLAQDNYTRELNQGKLPGVVLENEYLIASFAPTMGGKLWSLYDKVAGRELLFANPVARPAYLAVRNAWCSGGVEWNCGIRGHTPLTCDTLFTATLTGDQGEPILRMYEYERIRGVVYQMDFSLPSGSRVLIARMRVVNPSFRDTAMYWWSNIAVPNVKGARVVVPADEAYTPVNGATSIVPIPVYKGIDVTYPENNPVSVDYFFKTRKDRNGYTCQLDKDGYGLFEASTRRLQGRKIFVWGQGPGGRKWQEYLSGRGHDGGYCEIQCGLAHTQGECLPMPPATAWEWVEVYGALQADPAYVHGQDWAQAQAAVEEAIDGILPQEDIDAYLQASRSMALRKADKLLWRGAGWGALEDLRRASADLPPMCNHLDFGDIGPEQAAWAELLNNGSMGVHATQDAPLSWMRQQEWTELMERATSKDDCENWYTLLQLGCTWLAQPDLMRAEHYITRSLNAKITAWGLYAQAELQRLKGDALKGAHTMRAACALAPDDANLAKMTARMLHACRDYETLNAFAASRPAHIQELPRLRLYRAFALAALGQYDAAMDVLYRNNQWLEVPDIQEGEVSLSELWYIIQEGKAKEKGQTFDRAQHSPPYELDFRMFAHK